MAPSQSTLQQDLRFSPLYHTSVGLFAFKIEIRLAHDSPGSHSLKAHPAVFRGLETGWMDQVSQLAPTSAPQKNNT